MELPDPAEIQLAARHELWRRGSLRYKLHRTQIKLYDLLHKKREYFLLCSRRLGKSYLLICTAIEAAIRNPGTRVSYACATAKDAALIVNDLMFEILSDCPEDMMPHFSVAEKEYRFGNGSTIRFSGVNDKQHENLRGRKVHLFILDEAATMDDLSYILSGIVTPMTATTKGRILIATTPPRSPGHDVVKIIENMEARGELSKFTILDAPTISRDEAERIFLKEGENPDRVQDILEGKAEPETTTVLREYFCRLVTDSESAVVPEFTAQARNEIVRADWPVPPYYHAFVSLDPGFTDGSGGLFSYFDYAAQKLVIQSEFLLKRASTDDIAEEIKKQELELWGGRVPKLRICDSSDPRLIADMTIRHGLSFLHANRQNAPGAIDLVRTMVRRREVIIDPKCVKLIRQLTNATWSKRGNDFERSTDDLHFDLLAAFKYLARHFTKDNPYPSWWHAPGHNTNGTRSAHKTKSVFSDTPLGKRLSKKWG